MLRWTTARSGGLSKVSRCKRAEIGVAVCCTLRRKKNAAIRHRWKVTDRHNLICARSPNRRSSYLIFYIKKGQRVDTSVVVSPALDQDRHPPPTSSNEALAEALATCTLRMTAVELDLLTPSVQGAFREEHRAADQCLSLFPECQVKKVVSPEGEREGVQGTPE